MHEEACERYVAQYKEELSRLKGVVDGLKINELKMLKDSADEYEKEHLKFWVETVKDYNLQRDRNKELQAENQKLREALAECIRYCHDDTATERFKAALSINSENKTKE